MGFGFYVVWNNGYWLFVGFGEEKGCQMWGLWICWFLFLGFAGIFLKDLIGFDSNVFLYLFVCWQSPNTPFFVGFQSISSTSFLRISHNKKKNLVFGFVISEFVQFGAGIWHVAGHWDHEAYPIKNYLRLLSQDFCNHHNVRWSFMYNTESYLCTLFKYELWRFGNGGRSWTKDKERKFFNGIWMEFNRGSYLAQY